MVYGRSLSVVMRSSCPSLTYFAKWHPLWLITIVKMRSLNYIPPLSLFFKSNEHMTVVIIYYVTGHKSLPYINAIQVKDQQSWWCMLNNTYVFCSVRLFYEICYLFVKTVQKGRKTWGKGGGGGCLKIVFLTKQVSWMKTSSIRFCLTLCSGFFRT